MTDNQNIETTSFQIADRIIGGAALAFLIAEVAQAHDGSLGQAHAYIDAAAEVGADAIKFQTHIAAAESTVDEPFRVKFSKQDETRYAYWKRMEFEPEQWRELAAHAKGAGLIFLSSAFSETAVGMLSNIGVPAWKIASGELKSSAMLNSMIANKVPFLISSGMSAWPDIDALVKHLTDQGCDYAVLQCTSRYPTALTDVGLNVIDQMRTRYRCPVGLSDHSGQVFPALAALARGANLIEAHLTFDRRMFGPDVPASLTISEFQHLAMARDAFHTMMTHPVDKDAIAEELKPLRELFQRSLALRDAQPSGTVMTAEMLSAKKPGTGIPESDAAKLVGKTLIRDVPANRLLTWQDLA